MKDSSKMVKNMVMVPISGPMVVITQDTGNKTNFQVMDSINGIQAEVTKDNG